MFHIAPVTKRMKYSHRKAHQNKTEVKKNNQQRTKYVFFKMWDSLPML